MKNDIMKKRIKEHDVRIKVQVMTEDIVELLEAISSESKKDYKEAMKLLQVYLDINKEDISNKLYEELKSELDKLIDEYEVLRDIWKIKML